MHNLSDPHGNASRHDKYIADSDHLNDNLAGMDWSRQNRPTHPLAEGTRALFVALLGQAIAGAIAGNEDDRLWISDEGKYSLSAQTVCDGLSLDLDLLREQLSTGSHDAAEIRRRLAYRQVGNVSRAISEAPERVRKSSPYCNKWSV